MKTFSDEDLQRVSVGAESALLIGFALLEAVLERHDGDRRLGEAFQRHLVNIADDVPAAVVDIVKTASEMVAERTGAPMPSRFAPN